MNKTCRHCKNPFEITQDDFAFYDKISPTFKVPLEKGDTGGLKKYLIPPPTLCPDCRQQRRLSFRNERKLYKRTCDLCKKNIISIYSPDKPYTVYCQECWWSDKWDPLDYGRDFDFGRGFFEQFGEIMKKVPVASLHVAYQTLINSDYVNCAGNLKNCYLTFDLGHSEDCYYGVGTIKSNYILDFSYISNCEYCYECIECKFGHQLFFSQNSTNCRNSYFLYNCDNCEFCFGCINLINKKYYIYNKPCTKEEFKSKVIFIKNYKNLLNEKENFYSFCNKQIHKFMNLENTEYCSGDFISNSKNCNNCFSILNCEDCKNIQASYNCKDSHDLYSWGSDSNLIFDSHGVGDNVSNVLFSESIINSSYAICSSYLDNSFYTFGCIGLRSKSYCILNKQYTREEYEILVPKIIEHMMKTGEWGEFFPSSLSPFGYNETVAQEYFPMTREEVIGVPLEKGDTGGLMRGPIFNWSTYEAPFPKVDKVISKENMNKLPDNIKDIPDDILNWALTCEVSGKPFRIIKQELEFYRKHNIPVPRRHPDQRHLDRMKLRNPRKLYDRKCDKCGIEMKTTYAPDRPEIVYCEGCYNKEVY